MAYEIMVKGKLSKQLLVNLDMSGSEYRVEDDKMYTRIYEHITDQSALIGKLRKIHHLGIEIISVHQKIGE